jgi:hypothetical protein
MRILITQLTVAAACCVLICSCARRERFRKETFPVRGEVHVDGKPAASVAVRCHDVAGIDAERPTVSMAITQESGEFEIATYEPGDGVPQGEYVLTFLWGQRNLVTNSYDGPDKLDGRYLDPGKSKVRFRVETEQPTDLGRIELSTNAPG